MLRRRGVYARPMAFTDRLAMWAINDEKRKREKVIAQYEAEFGKPPADSLTTEQMERMVANHQNARRLQVVARRGDTSTVADPPLPSGSVCINNIDVLLPGGITLYPSQELMLTRILACLDAALPSAALIESATGSGLCSFPTTTLRTNFLSCKTMALLSGVCAWLAKHNKAIGEQKKACKAHVTDEDGNLTCECPRPTRVFYCTKTFAQLSQVVEEYSRLPYYKEETLRHTVLAGRDKLCTNREVRSSCGGNANTITLRCQNKLQSKGGGCRQFTELQRRYGTKPAELRQEIRSQLKPEKAFDIEDLHRVLGGLAGGGGGGPVCPYFAAPDVLYAKADIVFCVYPYVFDPSIRTVKNIDLREAIVIVDEGHNLLDVGCEALTFEFDPFRIHELCVELYDCVANLRLLIDEYAVHEDLAGDMLADARRRHKGLGMIGKCIANLYTWCQQRLEVIWAAEKFTFFGKPKLVHTLQAETFHFTLCALYFEDNDGDDPNTEDAKPVPIRDVCTAYEQFNALASGTAVYLTKEDNAKTRPRITSMDVLRKYFHFLFYYAQDPTQFRCTFEVKLDRCGIMDDAVFAHFVKESHNSTVRFWPLTASSSLRDIARDMRSLIVTSGTLSPVEMFESQFGIPFGTQELKLPSVVPAEQIFVAALPNGPLGKPIDGRFESARDPDSVFYTEVAGVIAGACRIAPDGIVCFFGSYAILENTAAVLRKKFAFFGTYKRLFTESAGGDSMRTMERYKEAVKNGDGALLLAVFRGSISEGINLSHELARCTIIVGIPFPNMSDEYVRVRSEALGGFEWSALHAFLAINQAIGRQKPAQQGGLVHHPASRLSDDSINAVIHVAVAENMPALLRHVNNAFVTRLTLAYRPDNLFFPRYLQVHADSLQCQIQSLNIEWSTVDNNESEIDYDLIEFMGSQLKPEVYKASVDHSSSDEQVMLFTHNSLRDHIKHVVYDVSSLTGLYGRTEPAPAVVIPELFRASVLESCAVTLHNSPRPWIENFIEAFHTAPKDSQVVRTTTLVHIRYGIDSHLRLTIAPFGLAQRDDVPAPHSGFVKEWIRNSQLNEMISSEDTVAERFTFKNRVAAKKLELFVWTIEHAVWNWSSVHYVYMLQVTDM